MTDEQQKDDEAMTDEWSEALDDTAGGKAAHAAEFEQLKSDGSGRDKAGGDVKLVWPESNTARRIFYLTKFDRVFDFATTAEAARQSFGAQA